MPKQLQKRPTVRDVAEVARVSSATVSRALQSPNVVSEKTRKIVLDAVEKTGYSINTAAQMLRRNRSGTILVILPDIANPFFSKLLSGIEQVATRENLTILIGNTNGSDERFAKILENLRNGRADGALLLNGRSPDPKTLQYNPAIVTISERIANSDLPHVGTDNEQAAFDATNYLLSLGHRFIVHVAGPKSNQLTEDRRAGYSRAMRKAGLGELSREFSGGFSFESGQQAAVEILKTHSNTTAVFCTNDESAMGVIREMQDQGYNVPEDYSVMGFDDIPFSRIFQPALTTIHQARAKIGVQAIETLLTLIDGDTTDHSKIFVPHEVVVRNSTASLGPLNSRTTVVFP